MNELLAEYIKALENEIKFLDNLEVYNGNSLNLRLLTSEEVEGINQAKLVFDEFINKLKHYERIGRTLFFDVYLYSGFIEILLSENLSSQENSFFSLKNVKLSMAEYYLKAALKLLELELRNIEAKSISPRKQVMLYRNLAHVYNLSDNKEQSNSCLELAEKTLLYYGSQQQTIDDTQQNSITLTFN